ncbi:hypothetical protein DSM112329_00946 [Paraconexibacter sp. AEG42_29]|uniref:Prenyltransferase n=1 Tax=Paraconexibacter sp. AEG42_29 TaxID=2997339 RepID=A0AAU7AR33_9ACTN
MQIDLPAAAAFMATHGRLLDRRRFERLSEPDGEAAPLLAALEPYRSADGGYGRGLEPDLRSATSQPGGALHAFEVFADAAPATSPRAAELCDWLARVTLPDGGLPFALPVPDPSGCAPFWTDADPAASSLQITAIVATAAWRVADHDPAVAAHPWLATATDYCVAAAGRLGPDAHALELAFALRLLDRVHDGHPDAPTVLSRLAELIPPDGRLPVAGGLADEAMRPLDLVPAPGTALRAHIAPALIDDELERLAGQQEPDGGWPLEWASYSPAAALEWRGQLTVRALQLLRENGARW